MHQSGLVNMQPVGSLGRTGWPSRRVILLQALAGLAVFLAVAAVQGIDTDFDVFNYHFYNGFALLHGRSFANVQPAMLQSFFSPLLDSAFYVLAHRLPPWAVLLILAGWQSLAYPLLFALAWRYLPTTVSERGALGLGTVLALLGALAPVMILEMGGGYGDATTVPLVLAAVLAISSTPRCWLVAGLLTGFAAGLKLTNAPFAVGLDAASIAVSIRYRTFGPALLAGAGIAAAFAVSYGWWAGLLWAHFRNPFFPFFNTIFRSPYAAAVAFKDPAFQLSGPGEAVLLPFRKAPLLGEMTPAGLFDARLAVALSFACLAVLARLFRKPPPAGAAATPLLVFFLTAYLAWLLAFALNRYVVALDTLAPLVVAVAAWRLAPRRAWALLLPALLLIPASQAVGLRLWWRPAVHRSAWHGSYFGDAPAALARDVPPNATIAMLGHAGLAYVIPFFPPGVTFVRLHGSLFYWTPGFSDLGPESSAASRRDVFGNAMGRLICRRLGSGPLFTLGTDAPAAGADAPAQAYFGIVTDEQTCRSAGGLRLCAAQRAAQPECGA